MFSKSFLRSCLEFFWEFLGGTFGRNLWEEFFGRIFWEDFFKEFFWEEFFERNFLGGIFWEEFFGRNFFGKNFSVFLFILWYFNTEGIYLYVKILVFVKILNQGRRRRKEWHTLNRLATVTKISHAYCHDSI